LFPNCWSTKYERACTFLFALFGFYKHIFVFQNKIYQNRDKQIVFDESFFWVNTKNWTPIILHHFNFIPNEYIFWTKNNILPKKDCLQTHKLDSSFFLRAIDFPVFTQFFMIFPLFYFQRLKNVGLGTSLLIHFAQQFIACVIHHPLHFLPSQSLAL